MRNKIFLLMFFSVLFIVPFVSATLVIENTTDGFSILPISTFPFSGLTDYGGYLYAGHAGTGFISKLTELGVNQTGFASPIIANTPYGININSTDEYIISEQGEFLSHSKGGVNQSDGCDLSLVADDPTGIYGNNSGLFWVIDVLTDKLFLINSSCNKTGEISIGSFGISHGFSMYGNENVLQIGDAVDGSIYCIDIASGTNRSDCFIDPKPFGVTAGQMDTFTSNGSNYFIYSRDESFVYNIHVYTVEDPVIVYWDNESLLNVNSSDYWDNLDTFNSTQMRDSNGLLTIMESWLENFIRSINIGNWGSDGSNIYNKTAHVGIGTDSPTSYHYIADDLVVSTSNHTGITIVSGNTSFGSLFFADGITGNESYRGYVQYDHNLDELYLATSGGNADIVIDADGYVGIQDAYPKAQLQVGDISTMFTVGTGSGASTELSRNLYYDGAFKRVVTDNQVGLFHIDPSGNFEWYGNSDSNTVADSTATLDFLMRLSHTGYLGIGTNVPTSPLQVVGLPVYANNSEAVTGGLTAGAFYRTGGDPDLVAVVH